MSKYMTNITVRSLLDSWLNAGLVTQSENARLEGFVVSQQQEKDLPPYLRILVGIGAFIASLCFISFLFISGAINLDSEIALIFWGLVFAGLAIILAKTSGNKDKSIKHSFLIQSSFCAMLIGKILFVTGLAFSFEKNFDWAITLATITITAATYHVYRMDIDRFLSTLSIFTSLFINLVSKPYLGVPIEIMLNLFLSIQIILAAVLLTQGRIKRDYIPLAYALVVSICISLIYFAAESEMGYGVRKQAYDLTFIKGLLTISLLGLIAWAAGSLRKLKTDPLLLASLTAVLLGIISAPGVIFSICLMVLAYAKHEKLLLILGILLMPVFIFFYYYNLDISLMAKSGLLLGSGILLLVGRGYLAVKQLDREI